MVVSNSIVFELAQCVDASILSLRGACDNSLRRSKSYGGQAARTRERVIHFFK
jgi:hypothetical protein